MSQKTVSLLALAACSLAATAVSAQENGTGRYDLPERLERFSRIEQPIPFERREQIVGDIIVSPTIVEAPGAVTIIHGSRFVNSGRVSTGNSEADAAFVRVRCPLGGGRILVSRNVFINRALIESSGNGSAALVSYECLRGEVFSVGNRFENLGSIIVE